MPAKKAAKKSVSKPVKKTATKSAKKSAEKTAKKSATKVAKQANVVLLSGGNPQIAKGYGDAPVQAYINALSDWQRDLARELDAVITRTLPKVQKAVKWNSPLYGMTENHYFVGLHVFKKYIKVAFFQGRLLKPMPPGESKTKNARYLDIREDDTLDEKQFSAWIKQASKLSGEKM